LVAADAEKAVLRTIATETTSFALLNILYLPVERRDFTWPFATNTGRVDVCADAPNQTMHRTNAANKVTFNTASIMFPSTEKQIAL
jgi:hypothetical protein